MSNKWILRMALLLLLVLLTGSAYLLLQQSWHESWQKSLVRADWFWWIFFGLLLPGVLANLWVFLSVKSVAGPDKKKHLAAESQRAQLFVAQQQQFFQRYGLLLQPLLGQKHFYLYADGNQRLLLQLYPDSQEQPGLEQMCSLLQSMLVYQCDCAFVVSLQPLTAQAKIFAREACIQVIDFSGVEQLFRSDNLFAVAC